MLHAPEHCGLAVAQVWPWVLDDGSYRCSQDPMQRILRAAGEGPPGPTDRSSQEDPRADGEPTRARSRGWDSTKLKGPAAQIYYDLYVVLDIYSRYVVNWLLATDEDVERAKAFPKDAIVLQGVTMPTNRRSTPSRGGAMPSKPVRAAARRPGRGQVPQPPAREPTTTCSPNQSSRR